MIRRLRIPAPFVSLLALAALGAEPSTAEAQSGFTAPTGPVLMMRELRSPLADGREVIARRTFALTFVRQADGWRIDGTLVHVDVEAPSSLQPIADLERKRVDTGLFPIYLDKQGLVIAMGEAPPTAGRTAVSAAMSCGDLGKASARDRRAAETVVRQVSAMPIRTPIPEMLFAFGPVVGDVQRRTTMAEQGTVTVETRVQGADGLRQLRRIDRAVTTELGATHRTLREVWLLSKV